MRPGLSLVVAAICAAGCSDRTPVHPTAVGSVSSTVGTDSLTNRDLPPPVVSRPLKGDCHTTFSPIAPPASGTCPVFEAVPSAFISIQGTCQLTHLGQSTTDANQQLVFALDAHGQPVLANGQPVVSRLVNCAAFTAANGDRLEFTAVASTSAGPAGATAVFNGSLSFTGGTGRFAKASGTASIDGAADLATSTGQFAVDGSVVY